MKERFDFHLRMGMVSYLQVHKKKLPELMTWPPLNTEGQLLSLTLISRATASEYFYA